MKEFFICQYALFSPFFNSFTNSSHFIFFLVVTNTALVYNEVKDFEQRSYSKIHIHKGEIRHGKFNNRPKGQRKNTTND